MTKLAKNFKDATRICANLAPVFTFNGAYDYRAALYRDLCELAGDMAERIADSEQLCEELYDAAFTCDGVTGNASGSYFFSRWKAEEALCHNLGLVREAYAEFGGAPDLGNPEAMDVTVRCYLLGEMADVVAFDISACLQAAGEGLREITVGGGIRVSVTRTPGGVKFENVTGECLGVMAA